MKKNNSGVSEWETEATTWPSWSLSATGQHARRGLHAGGSTRSRSPRETRVPVPQPAEGGGLRLESKRSFKVPAGDTIPSAEIKGKL